MFNRPRMLALLKAWAPLVLVLIASRALTARVIEVPIAAASITHERGHLYSVPVPITARRGASSGFLGGGVTAMLRACFDTDGDNPQRANSTLVVFADGIPLGPQHVAHEEISTTGRGGLSHWGSRLFFSPADGVDPRTGSVAYNAVWTAAPRGWVPMLLALAALAALVHGWRSTHRVLASGLGERRARRCLASALASALAVSAWWWLDSESAALIAWWVPPIVVVASLVIGLGAGVASRIGLRERWSAMRTVRRLIGAALIPLCLLVAVASVVAAQGGTLPVSLPGMGFALSGQIQLSDAAGYAAGAESVLAGAPLSPMGARRPLLVACLAALSTLSGSSDAFFLIQAVVVALALGATGLVVMARLGPWTAIGSAMVALAWIQGSLATTASEPLGCAFGACAVALLMVGLERRSARWSCAGIAALTISAMVRPGALIVIPFVIALVVIGQWRGRRWRTLLSAIVTTAVVASWPAIVSAALGSFGGVMNANFSHLLLGLACGSDWKGADERFAEELRALPTERDQSEWRWRKALSLIREEPGTLAGSLWRGLRAGATAIPHEAWRGSRASALIAATVEPVPALGEIPNLSDRGSRWRVLSWCAIGVWAIAALSLAARSRRSLMVGLLVVWAAGILVSLPIIWNDGGWRALAGSSSVLALLVMLPAWSMPWRGARRASARRVPVGSALLCGVVLGIAPAGLLIAIVSALAPKLIPALSISVDSATAQQSAPPLAAGSLEYLVSLGPRTARLRNPQSARMIRWPEGLESAAAALRADDALTIMVLVDVEHGLGAPAVVSRSLLELPAGPYRVITVPLVQDPADGAHSWRRVIGVQRLSGVRGRS